jgi:hypothetical protein
MKTKVSCSSSQICLTMRNLILPQLTNQLNVCSFFNISSLTSLASFRPLASVKHALQSLSCDGVNDICYLERCESVELACARVSISDNNLQLLRKVRTLRLNRCLSLTNISCLATVYDLSLNNCWGIEDVSMLGGVHRLDISFCDKITDVSALSKVYDLNICGCSGITDISYLHEVRVLNMCFLDSLQVGLNAEKSLIQTLCVSTITLKEIQPFLQSSKIKIIICEDDHIDYSLDQWKINQINHLEMRWVFSRNGEIPVFANGQNVYVLN